MKRKLFTWFLILIGSAFVSTAKAQTTTNSWSQGPAGSFKWETASDWSLHVPPSTAQSCIMITNFVSGSGGSQIRRVTIDATTVLSNAINGCMTISNLTLSSPSVIGSDELILNNTGSADLTIIQVMSISNHCTLLITNSALALAPSLPIFTVPAYFFGVDGAVLLEEGGTITVGSLFGSYGPVVEVVGVNSSGTLTVAGGVDYVESSGLAVGYNLGSTGTVLISSGTLNVSGDNYIGDYGVGSVMQSGGTAIMGGEGIGSNPGSQGTLTVAGGAHYVSSDGLYIGTGTAWVTGGTLTVYGDTTIVGSLIQSNGIIYTVGELLGNSESLLVIAGGTHVIGSDGLVVGELALTGTVWFTSGSLVATNQGGISITQGSLTQSNGTLLAFAETLGGYIFTSIGMSEKIVGDGTLTVAGGIHALGFGGLSVGVFAGSTGTVWFTGGQLVATSFSNIIGNDGVGSLVQSNGEMEMFLSEYVGYDAGGEGTLTVAGGTHTIEDGELTVGNTADSTGTVWVTGGQLETEGAVIGLAGVGQMTISNGNWQAGDVAIGAASGGNGTLTVASGTSVISADLTIGTPDCTGTGTVIVTGGSLFVTNATHDAVLDLENSTLTLSGGTLVADILVKTNPCAVFQQTGGRLIVGGVTNLFSPTLFSITAISREGNNIRITWQTPGGVTNIVQATNGGSGGSYNTNFVDLSPQFILTGGGPITTNYLDVGGATNSPSRFYRVRLVP